MMSSEKMNEQREKVFNGNSKVTLFAPCKVGEGIVSFANAQSLKWSESFYDSHDAITFFTPASGSGSRMFQFLYDFLENPDESNSAEMERFMNHLQDFAFYHKLPISLKEKIKNESIDPEELAKFLLNQEGLNFGQLPKGLIPFHFNDPVVFNSFQEHLVQGTKIVNGKAKFHFTIQAEFEQEIRNSLRDLEGMTGNRYDVDFSYQAKDTNSIAFDESQESISENGELLTRPAGHGALIDNLNSIETDFIFIKNIDNVQHYSSAKISGEYWMLLGNMLEDFKAHAQAIFNAPSRKGIIELNEKYQFLSPSEINSIQTNEDIRSILNRPTRICGMVKNEGQPGGGPFWIEKYGKISKQIIEKAQITQKGEQFGLMIKSTHFNPVMIALSTQSLEGKKFDLTRFVDQEQYFVVTKSHKGKTIKYLELPGLWNGGMANWNTVFVEAPLESFSPVKTVLDLLQPLHLK